LTLLRHESITAALAEEKLEDRLVVSPLLDADQIGTASIDLRLGTEFLIFRRALAAAVDPSSGEFEEQVGEMQDALSVPFGRSLYLHPQQFVLGATLEFIRLPPTMGGYVLGRSSWGRVGLIIATAVMVQPGFAGALTLELVNEGDSPIRLFPGLRIAQLALHSLDQATDHGYVVAAGKYKSPTGPQASKLAGEQNEIKRMKQLGEVLMRP
jgi:dCTP deaminase